MQEYSVLKDAENLFGPVFFMKEDCIIARMTSEPCIDPFNNLLIREPGQPSKKLITEFHDLSDSESQEKRRRIVCRLCSSFVAYQEDAIEKNGSHAHTFYNPEGVIYQIVCFSVADGCHVRGLPTSEFSWFPGYSWNYAACSSCRVHLGWMFHGDAGNDFFGLIADKLIELPDALPGF